MERPGNLMVSYSPRVTMLGFEPGTFGSKAQALEPPVDVASASSYSVSLARTCFGQAFVPRAGGGTNKVCFCPPGSLVGGPSPNPSTLENLASFLCLQLAVCKIGFLMELSNSHVLGDSVRVC